MPLKTHQVLQEDLEGKLISSYNSFRDVRAMAKTCNAGRKRKDPAYISPAEIASCCEANLTSKVKTYRECYWSYGSETVREAKVRRKVEHLAAAQNVSVPAVAQSVEELKAGKDDEKGAPMENNSVTEYSESDDKYSRRGRRHGPRHPPIQHTLEPGQRIDVIIPTDKPLVLTIRARSIRSTHSPRGH
jgi:hypothetical protein